MNIDITSTMVKRLIATQFPQYQHLSIKTMEVSGIDNRTFRLGHNLLIRLPSAKGYAAQVEKEQHWLPILSPHLSTQIPKPIAMGMPCDDYPWNFSIYEWIDGTSANLLSLESVELNQIAISLADFLTELHAIDTDNGPQAGLHNYYRGGHPHVYDEQARADIASLSDIVDANKSLAVWQKAISSTWHLSPVWVHGDYASGNILIKDNQLGAVIDFGCMGVGDPACDLVIAWTFLHGSSRALFKDRVSLDDNTWARARGWALWKAGFELNAANDKTMPYAKKRLAIIDDILQEHEAQL
jgi:aminoglycoside phosphotransferase (APT) family kinase protein